MTQRELRDRLGLDSGTTSRHMQVLSSARLVVRQRSHGAYSLAFARGTLAVLQAAADLVRDITASEARAAADAASELRKLGMRAGSPAARARDG
jgi:DNA-binding MarR family transcriptional regulator